MGGGGSYYTLQYIHVKCHITTVLRESVQIASGSVLGFVRVSEWESERVSEWVSEQAIEWRGGGVFPHYSTYKWNPISLQWLCDWVCERVSGRVSEWVSEWSSEWASEEAGGFTLQYIKVKFHITTVLRESVPIGNASVIGLWESGWLSEHVLLPVRMGFLHYSPYRWITKS